jgi:hypothetical protein
LLHDANAAIATGGGVAERNLLHSYDRVHLSQKIQYRHVGKII